MDKNTVYNVLNRSGSQVVYSIPEENIRREFAPNEIKRISYDELEKLNYIPGGRVLLMDFLQIQDQVILDNLAIKTEPEYFLTRDQVIDLLNNGSMDAFLDCLDFAPEGVLQLIKDLAIETRLNNVEKREAIKQVLGFDVSKAIEILEQEKIEASMNVKQPTERRVKPEESKNETSERRTSNSKYKVVTPKE